MTEETSSKTSSLFKYFVHGLAFSLIMLILGVGLAFLLVLLVAIGFIIGLIVGFLILLMVHAGINVFLMDRIWHVPIKTNWTSLLAHRDAFVKLAERPTCDDCEETEDNLEAKGISI